MATFTVSVAAELAGSRSVIVHNRYHSSPAALIFPKLAYPFPGASTPPDTCRMMDQTAPSMMGVFVQIQFMASVAAIAADPEASRRLYVQALGLPLDHAEGDDYYHSENIGGSKHFGVWPLAQAAHACFGGPDWPEQYPVPQASIEFEVTDAEAVGPAAAELAAAGFPLLHDARLEPWGQTVARLLSPEGLIVGISYARGLH
jgi:catechol 2,3-dioxygenase-like lactoylglutathione lyase family enzyme